MLFKEIIGQQKIKDRLIQTVKDNRISHAQLFLGPEGSGNLALAIAYAQYIACTNKHDSDSCGVCPSCQKFAKLVHPDLHFVFPVATTKAIKKDPVSDDFIAQWREALIENPYINQTRWYDIIDVENKQGLISKNESSVIVRKLSLKTFEADYKTLIMWLPEKMNSAAANTLLKIIEEPPSKTLFILVSENSEQIITTILSRTQLIKIPQIDAENLHTALCDRMGLNADKAYDIVHLANGNYLSALNLIETTDENSENHDRFVEIMRFCYQNKIIEIVNWVESISTIGREKQKRFLEYAIRMIRENFMLNINQKNIVYLTKQEAEFSNKFYPFINKENVFKIYEHLNRAFADIEMNAYNKIVFLDLGLKLVKLINK
ncbi:MAG: DNA polymerase III subunit delta [Bacteroidales bacterium]|jgi:DNA polymerase-3 subunit delta'|nr:DNA polymerase III subunit delta [Bacteroidales bacterium]